MADEFQLLGREIAFGSAFLANFNYYQITGYFDRGDELKYLLNLWSLAIEEQFYLIWPLLLMLFLATRVSLTYLLVALMIVSFGFGAWYTSSEQSFAF